MDTIEHTESQAPKKRSFLKKLLWGSGILTAIFLTASIVIAAFFGDEVGKLVLGALKKNLTSELTVEELELSVFWSFPNASVNLKNIEIKEANGEGTLLKAETFSARIGLWGLLTGNYNLKSIVVQNGEVYINRNRKGEYNYNIFKTSASDTITVEGKSLNLAIKEARFNNMRIIYLDEIVKQEVALEVKESRFAGAFSGDKFSMDSHAEIFCGYVEVDDEQYFLGKSIAYDAIVDIDFKEGRYDLSEVYLTLETNEFKINGLVETLKEGTNFDLDMEANDGSLSSLLDILPSSVKNSLGGFKSKADLFLKGNVNGMLTKSKLPAIDIQFGLNNGKVTHPDMRYPLKDVNFNARVSAEEGSSYENALFEVKNFKANLDRHPLSMTLKVKNVKDPFVQFGFDGVLSMRTLYSLIGDYSDGSGEVDVKGLVLRGRYKDMVYNNRVSAVDAAGTISFDDVSLSANGEKLMIDGGSFILRDNRLKISNLDIEGCGSDFALNGTFNNALPVLFSDSTNSKKAELKFDANLNCKEIDAERLIKFASIDLDKGKNKVVKDSLQKEQTERREFLANFLDGNFQIAINDFSYGKVKAQEFRGDIEFNNSVMELKGLRADGMKGTFELNGKVYFQESPYLDAYVDLLAVDAKELFYQCENFFQEVLTSDNISGNLDANVKVKAYWDELGEFKMDDLYALADVTMREGMLKDFEMLKRFSKYVKIKDLRTIRFSETRNQFEVKNSTFFMPAMFIQSNALNLVISGKHTFDHDMDYLMKINAGQVLANRFKKHNKTFEPLPARKKGFFNIYCRIFGNLYGTGADEYQIKLGKKGVKSKLDAQLNREYVDMHNDIKAEFSGVKKVIEKPEELDEKIPEYGEGEDLEDEDTYLDFGEDN